MGDRNSLFFLTSPRRMIKSNILGSDFQKRFVELKLGLSKEYA
jgi:hypothetical protein